MWTADQWAGLLGAAAVVITAVGGLIIAIAQLVKSWRKPDDDKPAPEVGIPAAPAHDDIDYRAYVDLKERLDRAEKRAEKAEADRDAWMRRALGIDEDTHPLDPKT